MPALLKAFLEQVLRPGLAFEYGSSGMPKKLLTGKSARIIVAMGMPAFVYRWYFRAHSFTSLARNILGFVGIGPIKASLIGMVEGGNSRREKWIAKVRVLGRKGRQRRLSGHRCRYASVYFIRLSTVFRRRQAGLAFREGSVRPRIRE
jgi:putative NADPH-quinone reductase